MQTHFEFELPAWVQPFVAAYDPDFSTPEKRMAFVIALSAENIQHKTGGPFAAAIFDDNNQLIAPGINLVTSNNCSILHAEMVAIALAQKTLGRYDLSNRGTETYELAASTEPCAMCFGAVPWSGVKRLLCGARKADAEAVGFDEGVKPDNWEQRLENRGIEVHRDVLRDQADVVIKRYAEQQGTIY